MNESLINHKRLDLTEILVITKIWTLIYHSLMNHRVAELRGITPALSNKIIPVIVSLAAPDQIGYIYKTIREQGKILYG